MNKIYRLIWSEVSRAWVAVSELVKSRGRRASGAASGTCDWSAQARRFAMKPLALALVGIGFAQAAPPAPTQLPTGGQIVAGTGKIAQSGATMNINQSTQRAAIDWKTFNVGAAAAVNFLQPSSSSVTLNRVLDANPSQIFGRISAPGQVFLSNPSGVYFAPGASVDVGAFEIGIILQDVVARHAASQHGEHVTDRNAQAPDARAPVHLRRVYGYAVGPFGHDRS